MKRCLEKRETKLIQFQQKIDEKQAATNFVGKRKLVHNDTCETAGKRTKFHKATGAKPNVLEESVVPGNVDAQCQFSNPGTRSLKMVFRVPKKFQINEKQIAVKKIELTRNDICGITEKPAKFHIAAAGEPDILEKSVIQGNSNVQCQFVNPGTKSLKMVIRVPNNCQRNLSSATTEARQKQKNIMEKSAIPINSNNQSESSDSDSGYFKTAICVPKKCRKSSSAITKKKAPLMQKALKYIKHIKTVRGY